MKADRNGTWIEQVRARMGWKSPKERKGDGKPHVACNTCKYLWLKEIPNRDGACPNYSPYCGHPQASGEFGHTTREAAICDHWSLKG